jgi:hypothetical protein
MDPAFPDVVGEWAAEQIDDRAKVWTVSKGTDGRLEERLDKSFLARLEQAETPEEIAEAILAAAAERQIAETRVW